MVKVKVNGVEVDVAADAYVVDAVRKAGFDVPMLCYLEGLYREAMCRVCLVELANGRLIPACAFPVQEGLDVRLDTPSVRRARKHSLELLLAAHTFKCWECPRKGGDCDLLRLSKGFGLEGIPVCSECPLQGDQCLVRRGIPCLGPVTIAGCDGWCVRDESPCIGCRGPLTRRDILERAARFYVENGIGLEDLLPWVDLFWSYLPEREYVKKIIGSAYGDRG